MADRPKDLPRDQELRRALVGTWAVNPKLANGAHRNGVLTIGADGTFTGRSPIEPPNGQGPDYESDGKWEVMDGFLILQQSGLGVDHDKILHIDERTLILENAGWESNGILVRPLQIGRTRYTRIE